MTANKSICKTCKHRFRRVFIPLNPEEYLTESGERALSGDENIIIVNQCLLTDMDIDNEETIECSGYEKVVERKKRSKKSEDLLLVDKLD